MGIIAQNKISSLGMLFGAIGLMTVSYTHLRAHETRLEIV